MKIFFRLVFFGMLSLPGCDSPHESLFVKRSKEEHGIDFQNVITESDSLNILTLEYIYNGAGVAVADFNNDGQSDVFLTGNMVANRLYLNKGDLRFEDVSQQAGIMAEDKWKSGVAVADVNDDGLPDIYVCSTIKKDSALRANSLFINQGLNKEGMPTFKDEAATYGLNYSGYSTNAAFLDYDKDGDLDLYILTNTIQQGIPTSYRPKINDGSTINTDRLFRNNGNKTFTDVSIESGIVHEGYGLGLAVADLNNDGWPDIYVSNDYITNDLLYINNRNGTFTNSIDYAIRHQSQFSMGNDVADINNDALPDILTLDMLPEGNLRRKTVISGPTYTSYINNARYGYSHQYIRNMLQLNNGDGTFSEIGQLSGVHQTEWSWSPLFADFDNDGFKDLIVTNGFPRDITDKDFGNFRNNAGGAFAPNVILLDSVPVVKVANYAFKNNGNLRFHDVTKSWGMDQPSFSNGAAFADFDSDGDLDYIVNNINDEVSFYENMLYNNRSHEDRNHYLRLKLKGKPGNPDALGAKVAIYYKNGSVQYHDHSIYRGYLSTVESTVHFGLGPNAFADSLIVLWPDNTKTIIRDVKADQLVSIDYERVTRFASGGFLTKQAGTPLLKLMNSDLAINHVHEEQDKIDFNVQRTLPHKLSQSGPGIAVGDLNNDGLDDIYVGGSSGVNGTLLIQKGNGKFVSQKLPKPGTGEEEDMGALFFDADQDDDLDLYVVGGSFEFPVGAKQYQDRLYRNNGKGGLVIDTSAVPATTSSGSCVRAADFDRDGDLDLFVGGRVVPAAYPMPAQSHLLINERGKFTDQTNVVCPELSLVGMVSDALWTDYNTDGKIDLMIAGEFMPLVLFENNGQRLTRIKDTGLDSFSGWWNSLGAADFDHDGDTDYVAGNLGLNNYYKASNETPLRIYAKDFDGNNSVDAVLSCYLKSEEGDMKEYPVHFWEELNSQSPKFRRKFNFYKKFGRATLHQLLTPEELGGALILETNYTASSYIENLGSGKFKVSQLSDFAQFAPVNGIVADDFDFDGYTDLMLVGNDYGNEVFTGRHDAFSGLILKGDGRGKFSDITSPRSGFKVSGDAKALAKLINSKGPIYAATQNQDTLKVFGLTNTKSAYRVVEPKAGDQWAELVFRDNSKQRIEFYWGNGYLSQSTRKFTVPANAKEVTIYGANGKRRSLSLF